MNVSIIIYILGNILKVEGILLFLPLIVSLIYKEDIKNTQSFLIVIALVMAIGFITTYSKPKKMSMQPKDGFVIVALSWVLLSFFGALPFVFSSEIPSLVDAFFETSSGFTTTGSTILTDVEALSNSMLFWRSFTHLIGGMGVLVFALAILPSTGLESVHVMKAEVPGPVFGKLVAKMRLTARILYGIYLVLTAILTILLLFGGMDLFEAMLHAFGTAGTGGFGLKNSSIAYYDSAYIDIILSFGMLAFGINFNLYYMIMIGDIRKVFDSEELKLYLKIVVFAILCIFINVGLNFGFSFRLLRDVLFQVSSIVTTTGYSTVDFVQWPLFSNVVLILLMFIGACAGSTAGGLKVSRVGILFKSAYAELKRVIQPNRIVSTKFDGKVIDSGVISSIVNYFVIYMLLMLGLVLIVSFDSPNFTTAFSAVVATYNNIGPGLDVVGPVGNFSGFSDFTKIVLSFSMISGRLEIYPMLILGSCLFKNLDLK